MEAQTRSSWIVLLKLRIRSIVYFKSERCWAWITQSPKSSFSKSLFLFLLIFLTVIWFSSLFIVFISLSDNFISVWSNICSNNFSSISFDMSGSCILKNLDFNFYHHNCYKANNLLNLLFLTIIFGPEMILICQLFHLNYHLNFLLIFWLIVLSSSSFS